jgi:hypothetical protein
MRLKMHRDSLQINRISNLRTIHAKPHKWAHDASKLPGNVEPISQFASQIRATGPRVRPHPQRQDASKIRHTSPEINEINRLRTTRQYAPIRSRCGGAVSAMLNQFSQFASQTRATPPHRPPYRRPQDASKPHSNSPQVNGISNLPTATPPAQFRSRCVEHVWSTVPNFAPRQPAQ